MTMTPSLQYAMDVVKELEPEEQHHLAHLLLDLLYHQDETNSEEEIELIDLAGIAPNLLGGEDPQEWVSRTRREGTELREAIWKRD